MPEFNYYGGTPGKLSVDTSFFNSPVFLFDELDSTNKAINELTKIKGNGFVVASRAQSKGEGRLGREWHSGRNMGLWFSFSPVQNISPGKWFLFNFAVAVGMAEAITGLLKDNSYTLSLKWPNDILLNGKKVCGIIIRSKIQGNNNMGLTAGIGLNLNQSEGDFLPEFRDKAISLKIIDGSERDIGESLVKVVEALDRYLLSSFKSDFSETVDDWKNLSLPVGSPIAVSLSAGRKREGTYLGIDENGNLKFGAGGKTEIISSADVEVF